jgi:hypothetical protein
MKHEFSRGRLSSRFGCVVLGVLLFVSSASGHVDLEEPNGGEVFEVGATVTVVWRNVRVHPTQNWDLWYSTRGLDGEFLSIAADLPVGEPAIGSVHTYEWIVPDAVSPSVRVRVEQDNGGENYFGTSVSDLSIIPLQSFSRMQVIRLNLPLPDGDTVFRGPPCSRMSDLRICAEAPGTLETVNDPLLPLVVADDGDLVMIEFDSDLTSSGTTDEIRVSRGPGGELIIDVP